MSKKPLVMAEEKPLEGLWALASRQAGYVTTRQARELGLSNQILSYHARPGGQLDHVKRGLYRLRRYPPSKHETTFATWLSFGQPLDAVVSHESAAEQHDLGDFIPDRLHLTVSRRHTGRRAPAGVQLHFTTNGIPAEDRTTRNAMPVASVERTIADLVQASVTEQTELVVAQTLDRGLTTVRRIRAAADSRPKTVRRAIDGILDRGGGGG